MIEVDALSTHYNTRKVKTTGHSLGAAIAQLLAMDFVSAGYDVSMYNFGQPRVGNKAYATYSNQLMPDQFRHTHFKDLVPRVPSEEMQFYHC